ncbi:5-formyltetrahydrofolate cyclo-ligase [Psychroflexus planctonicus]|uniref:5-formyltetrahydrofolate cyclo-ligase n=1 Tax=Psychroflexus planctonicus TaxID=1526575 RepID=A0ABQ1SI71_9FLAO|nr:5-formyltetrahydrofolate cyclo-ligase [Psychroflexus planctonicus]GGE38037.1 5-formyltetrahydrofolate cyclo-ligase [Psychroflexus planctonicus]
MNKARLRSFYKAKRKELSNQQIEEWSLQIANQSLQLPIWEKEFYHLFLPIEKQNEVNTEFLLHILQGKDKNVVISKSNFKDLSLEHILLTDATEIKLNAFGIPEPQKGIEIQPQQLDVVFIPLLVSDKEGNRIGYGKGFYDRFLSKCKADVQKVGLSFFEPVDEIIEVSTTDINLDYLVTPSEIFQFKA